ncbi:MAG: ABC transporter permease subunit [Acidobacteriota bacterium]|jgi:ABC-type transport system involved in multi-copper enzyme maturation permease subunit
MPNPLTLALKEVREGLLTLRFQAGTVLAVVLVAISVWALADDYGRRIEGHSHRVALNEAHLAEYGHLNRLGSVYAVGEVTGPMTAWVRGLSQGTRLEQFDNDPLPVLFPLVDMVAVITVVFSLLALVFTFDAVTGERRNGTLRLLTTFELSRAGVVTGKLLGAVGTVAVPFASSWLVAALVVVAVSPVPWGPDDWLAAIAIGLGGLLYAIAFAALGVAISTVTRRPRTSAFVALAAWVVLVLVIPNLAPFLAAEARPIPSATALHRRIARMTDTERDALQDRLRQEAFERLQSEDPAVGRYLELPRDERAAAAATDPALARAAAKVAEANTEANREGNRIQGEKVEALQADFDRRVDDQVRLARALSLASPTPAFTYLATDLAETGLRHRERLEVQEGEFETLFRAWAREKYDRLSAQDPTRDWANTPTDLSDVPRFTYRSEPLSGRLAATIPWFVTLTLHGVLFTAVAAFAFGRYDVR